MQSVDIPGTKNSDLGLVFNSHTIYMVIRLFSLWLVSTYLETICNSCVEHIGSINQNAKMHFGFDDVTLAVCFMNLTKCNMRVYIFTMVLRFDL